MEPIAVYKRLLLEFGPQYWWPVTEKNELVPSYRPRKAFSEEQRFEICAGAILAQNTDWKNVMKALENLSKARMLSCEKIANAKQERIAGLVKPSGYFNQKAKRLVLFAKYLEKNYGYGLSLLFEKPLPVLREELLSLHGIGNETADDIILYAAGKPSFVIDAYTMRFVERFYGKEGISYVEAKQFFELQLPKDVALFNEFHALLVGLGKRFCRKKPNCGECFLGKHCSFCAEANN
ncbi:MAG: endonuclease III domain-containing protein [archaeon]